MLRSWSSACSQDPAVGDEASDPKRGKVWAPSFVPPGMAASISGMSPGFSGGVKAEAGGVLRTRIRPTSNLLLLLLLHAYV